MTVDYRTAARRCELCGTETAPRELSDLTGLGCCKRCVGGDLDRAVKHWGFKLAHKFTAGGRQSTASFFIEIRRPTFVEAFAKFDAESRARKGWLSRLFKQRDPQVGDEEFDEEVLIAPDAGADEPTMRLLQHAGVRQAVLELVRQGAKVDLTGNSVWVHDTDEGLVYKMATMEVALPFAMALAVHIERIARGG